MANVDVFKVHEDAVGFCRALCEYMTSLGLMLRTPASHVYGYGAPRLCTTLHFSSTQEYSREYYKTILRDFVSTTGRPMQFKSTARAGAKVQCAQGDIVDISLDCQHYAKNAIEFNGILVGDIHEILAGMSKGDWMSATHIFDYCYLFKNFNVVLSSNELTIALFARMLRGVCWWDIDDYRTSAILESMPELIHNGSFPINDVWNALDDSLRFDHSSSVAMLDKLRGLPGFDTGTINPSEVVSIALRYAKDCYTPGNPISCSSMDCSAYRQSDEFIRLTMPEYYAEVHNSSGVQGGQPSTDRVTATAKTAAFAKN